MIPEAVLMVEQLDDGPFTACQAKHFTAKDSGLSQVLTYVSKGWVNYVNDDDLKCNW